jgi:hypothetical protein
MAPMNALKLWNVPRLSLFSKLVKFSQKEKVAMKWSFTSLTMVVDQVKLNFTQMNIS